MNTKGSTSEAQVWVCLGQRLAESFRRHADRVAVETHDGSITYAELDKISSGVRDSILARLTEGTTQRVGLLSGNSVDKVIMLSGAIRAGVTFVPLDSQTDSVRLSQSLAAASCDLVIVDDEGKQAYDRLSTRQEAALVTCDDLMDSVQGGTDPVAAKESIAYVIFTSGSAGRPKGVEVPHRAMMAFCDAAVSDFGIHAEDRLGVLQHFSFDYALMDLLPTLLVGATLVLVPVSLREDPEQLNEFLIASRITVQTMLTPIYESFIDFDNSCLRQLLVGGEKMRRFRPQPYSVYNLYGPTEAAVYTTSSLITAPGHDVPIGRPTPGTEVVLRGADGSVVNCGVGEICLLGDQLAVGYLDDPETTASAFVPGPWPETTMYRTGDLGYWDDAGELHITGRVGRQIKHRGYRIELDEIEGALGSLSGVDVAAVIYAAHLDPAVVVGFYTSKSGLTPAEALYQLAEIIPRHELPDQLECLEKFPLTGIGKVDRRGLANLVIPPKVSIDDPEQSSLSLELRSLWAKVLHLAPEAIGDDDDFTMLGGHSILMLRMLRELREAMGVKLGLHEVMAKPTIKGLRELIENIAEPSPPVVQTATIDSESRWLPFPLTDMQQAYLVGRDAGLGGLSKPTYIQLDLTIHDYHRDRVLAVLQSLWQRHDALSLRINDAGHQYIAAGKHAPCLIEVDLCDHDATSVQRELGEVRNSLIREPLDYRRDPLVRCALVQTDVNTAVLMLYFDGFIADGWSQGLFVQEFSELYADQQVDLPTSEIGFRDYVLHLEELKKGPQYAGDLGYWTRRAESLPGPPQLPLAIDPGTVERLDSSRVTVTVPSSIWSSFERMCGRYGASAFLGALAVFGRVIGRFSGTRDFLLSVPDCARYRTDIDIDRLFGECATHALIEFADRPDQAFYVTVQDVLAQFSEATEHNAVSGVEVLRQIARTTGQVTNVAPLVFTSLLDNPTGSGTQVAVTHFETHTSQVWMDVIAVHGADGVDFHWHFVKDLFRPGWVDQVANLFLDVVVMLAENPVAWQRAFHIPLPSKEAMAVDLVRGEVYDWGDASVPELLVDSGRRNADLLAVCTQKSSWTYREVYSMAADLIDRLVRVGVKPGDRVAVTVGDGVQRVASVLAVMLIGATFVPVEAGLLHTDVTDRMAISGVSVLVTDSPWPDISVNGRQMVCVDVENLDPAGAGAAAIRPVASPQDLLTILFTSGTTGEPKAVAISDSGVKNCLLWTNREFSIEASDRLLSVTNPGHDMALFDILGLLVAGGAVMVPEQGDERNPGAWLELIETHGLTVWSSAPALMEMLVTSLEVQRRVIETGLRVVILGGDRLPKTLPARVRATLGGSAQVINVGGPTEATIWSIWHRVGCADEVVERIPLGRAIPNTSYEILNQNGEICPIGVPGMMVASGVNVSPGYLNDPELTRSKFIIDPISGARRYVTGDIGVYLPSGQIDIIGREDAQVKINGKRIELGGIDAAALRIKGVRSAVAFVVEMAGRSRLALRYVTDEGLEATDLVKALRLALPSHLVPSEVAPIDHMPLTRNGKVDRRSPELAQFPRYEVVQDEGSSAEISRIFANVLGVRAVSPDDNFFALGGDSIMAIYLQERIAEELGIQVSLGQLFAAPTPRLLQLMVRSAGA